MQEIRHRTRVVGAFPDGKSALKILDVSLRVGFGNLSEFNRRFREIKKITPRQIRLKAADATGQR